MIYITGDTHGEEERLSVSRLKALKAGDTLIICGDFGFIWDGDKKEQKFLKQLGKRKYNVCFLDGTHENFFRLNDYEISEWNGGKVHKIYGNLYHLLRGQVFEIEGKKIFAMGGGESPDIDIRAENEHWSRDEIPSQEELYEGAKNLEKAQYKIDIVVTHEPPMRIKRFLQMKDYDTLRVTALNAYFEELSDSCDFSKWFFGSLHMDKYISNTHMSVFKNIVNAETGEKLK
ncbi:MAG: metallophosphoesterase [Oscillospiraceae bacterium]